MSKSDFEYLKKIMKEFFDPEKIRESLQIIRNEKKITGWEKWLQTEFRIHLANLKKEGVLHDWQPEKKYYSDRRSSNKAFIRADFAVQPAGKASDRLILIEFKTRRSVDLCIKEMTMDIGKLDTIRTSEAKFSSSWAVGVHYSTEKKSGESDKDIAAKINERYSGVQTHTEVIGNTGFQYTVFG